MQVGGCVEYTKEQHLYRILVPSVHILLTFCIIIGAFDLSLCFWTCAGFSGTMHNCYRGSCPENRMWITEDDGNHCCEVLGS